MRNIDFAFLFELICILVLFWTCWIGSSEICLV